MCQKFYPLKLNIFTIKYFSYELENVQGRIIIYQNYLKGHEKEKTNKFPDKKNMLSLMKHIPNGKKSDREGKHYVAFFCSFRKYALSFLLPPEDSH